MNQIELIGVVGRAETKQINNNQVCNFSVVTEYSTKDKEKNSIIETNWFNVAAWKGWGNITDLDGIQKGAWIRVVGRIRERKYTSQSGEERTATDIVAHTINILPKDDIQMQPERM